MKCPAPWCGKELSPGRLHPDHEALMATPGFDPKKHVKEREDGGFDIFFPIPKRK